jgi:glycosyltransferase involved in cell wall biosynthesis
MASGCIMIVPLFSGSGIRIKIIEGMVMGKAMVVTSKAIQGLDLSPEQEVLVADAPEMFADAVVRLIANADLRRSIGNQAKLKAQLNFDLEKSSRELSEFLDAFLH